MIQKTDHKSADPLLTAANVLQLLEELKDAQASKSYGKTSTKTVVVDGKQAKTSPESSLIPLEQRIRRLETVVGNHDGTKQSLLDTIDDLKWNYFFLS